MYQGLSRRWQQTSWGRLLIGLMLAQGLFYGVRHLLTGVLLALESAGANQDSWSTFSGLILLQTLQVITLLIGSILAGSSQRQGFVLGAIVGMANGILCAFFNQAPIQTLTPVLIYGQPMLHMVCGALGGWIGSTIWKPLPTFSVAGSPIINRKPAPPRPKNRWFAGRISWFRVLAGSAFAVAGALSATYVLQLVLDASGGKLVTTDDIQDWLIVFEIRVLCLLMGGALAGSNTTNGVKQGLAVGLMAGIILMTMETRSTDKWLVSGLLTFTSTFTLTAVGGWFGSQLFPPVLKYKRIGHLGRGSV
jgi:hypothetical protein